MPCLGVLTIGRRVERDDGRRVERDDGFTEITVSVCSPNQLAWFEAWGWVVGRLEIVPEQET